MALFVYFFLTEDEVCFIECVRSFIVLAQGAAYGIRICFGCVAFSSFGLCVLFVGAVAVHNCSPWRCVSY